MTPYEFTLELVVEVGTFIKTARTKEFSVGSKGGNSRDIVTSVDDEANELLLSAVRKTFPTHRIYSEEGGGTEHEDEYLWVIDPIDGSSNYARGIPHYAVCIGLLHKGVPILGAVYNPNTKELFSFEKGKGAFLNGEAIAVSGVTDLAQAQVVMSPGSRKPELFDWAASSYRKLLEHTQKRGMYGSSALDICYVACGRADVGVYGTLTTYDIAGALGILYEAGGAALGSDGLPVALSEESQKVYFGNSTEMSEAVRTLLEA